VVVKFRPDADLPHGAAAGQSPAARVGAAWDDLVKAHPGIVMAPYFESHGAHELRQMESAHASKAGGAAAAGLRLTGTFAIQCPAGADGNEIARQARTWRGVEIAYLEGGPTPPPVSPADDPRETNQGFHRAAPAGIDARWAWNRGIDGHGVGFVDLEQGWTLNHEDLAAAGISIISGQNQAYPGHGTAVLGEVVGVDNATGGVGIAPVASTRVVSQWRTATSYNTADAILSAAATMSAGDVLLLEAQTTYGGGLAYLPVEVEQATFDAIAYATGQGIVVVEAGGNGSVDLDGFRDANGKAILNRGSADFRDSGAIMVGAASSGVPHARLSFSNYGSRIDCFAWGQDIDTCGDGWMGNLTNSYTTGFGGTSGASPIVTGAALALQAYAIGRGANRYPPHGVRALLADPSINTASGNPPTDRIGVLPNLRAIIEREDQHIDSRFHRWSAVMFILFGIIQDGGGLGIRPGGGPVPVDPWGPYISAEQAEALVGMAVMQLAPLAGGETSQRALTDAGLATMRRSLENMSKQR
jgi:hypothetical protein